MKYKNNPVGRRILTFFTASVRIRRRGALTLTVKHHRLPGRSLGLPALVDPKMWVEKWRSDTVGCDYPNVAFCGHHCVHRACKMGSGPCEWHEMELTFIERDIECPSIKR